MVSKNRNVIITKASGERTLFMPKKLKLSLHRAGANDETIDSIMSEMESQVYEGIPTTEIYKIAFSLLKNKSRTVAARYKLKRAILELGPSGFPFEKYIAAFLSHQGYRVKVGEIVKGHCVNHEIDVMAERENHHFMVECKFHNLQGTNCDVKIPLYIQAHFKDVEEQWKNIPGHGTKFHQGWVVTNTRFSDDAIKYGSCARLNLLSLDFLKGNSLREQIDASGLYPLTCLTTLSLNEKKLLLDNQIVLCRELCLAPDLLSYAKINKERRKVIMNEAQALCNRAHK